MHWSALVASMAIACRGEERPGAGIELVLATDMTVPDSIDEVGLYIQHLKGAQSKTVVAQEVKPLYNPATQKYEVRFSATLVLEAGENSEQDRVRVRFIGFKADGTPSVMREARSAVPQKEVTHLRLPLLFVNEDTVIDTAPDTITANSAETGARTDVFTRFRTAGCADEQTRGNDGACRSIDVTEADFIPNFTRTAEVACFDTIGCFGGPRGSRPLPLEGCSANVPEVDIDRIAVALPSAKGYPFDDVGNKLQPVDDGLYRYDATTHTIQLGDALCQRVEREALSKLYVSIKCAPKTLDVPLCAPWQDTAAATPPTQAGFPDDPPPSEPDAGDAGDAGPDAAPPPLDDVVRVVELVDPPTQMRAFAADARGRMWFAGIGSDESSFVWYVPEGDPGPIDTDLSSGDVSYAEHLELGAPPAPGAAAHAYLLPDPTNDNASPILAVNPAARTLEEVRFGACASSTAPRVFSVGTLGNQTVAAYAGPTSGGPLLAGGPASTPTCFPDMRQLDDYFGNPYRGSELQGQWHVPTLAPDILNVAPQQDAGSVTVLEGVGDRLPQSFIDLGDDDALVVAKLLGQTNTTSLYGVQTGPTYRLTERLANIPGTTSREVFGGDHKLCARFLQDAEYPIIRCYTSVPGGALTESFTLEQSSYEDELHLYGDAQYMYISRFCAEGENSVFRSVKVMGVPWSRLNAASFADFTLDCRPYFQIPG